MYRFGFELASFEGVLGIDGAIATAISDTGDNAHALNSSITLTRRASFQLGARPLGETHSSSPHWDVDIVNKNWALNGLRRCPS